MENKSGMLPRGRAVLCCSHQPEMDKMRAETGIVIPLTVEEREAIWENRVRVVAIGKACWSDEPEHRAAPGDIVLVTRFAGFVKKGADGLLYRFVNDRDIFGLFTSEAVPDDQLMTYPGRDNAVVALREGSNG